MTVQTAEFAAPDGLDAISGLTAPQRRRLRKKMRAALKDDVAYVTCEECGWTGFDVHHSSDPDVTPCPKCGHFYARLAAPPIDGPWWD